MFEVYEYDFRVLEDYEILEKVVIGNEQLSSKTDMLWHHDKSFEQIPPPYVAMQCLKIDPAASPTYFADLLQAYKEAPQKLKDKAENMICKHSLGNYTKQSDNYPINFANRTHERYFRLHSRTEHPLVLETELGKMFYYSTGYVDAGDLTKELNDHCFQDKYIMTHHWKPGQLVLWDNFRYPHARDKTDDNLDRRFIRYGLRKNS